MEIVGTVYYIVSSSPMGGAIFRLRSTGTSKSIRVRASYKVMPHAPVVGEQLWLEGTYVQTVYGLQFEAEKAVPDIPLSTTVNDVLCRQPIFCEISSRRSRTVCRNLGDKVISILDSGDILALQRAGAGTDAAGKLAIAWETYRKRIETLRFLLLRNLTWPLASRAWDFFGEGSVTLLSGNPYLLLAIAEWPEVDLTALTHFGINRDSPQRVLGACHSIFNDALAFGKAVLMRDIFQRELKDRLGLEVNLKDAYQLGITAGVIRQVQVDNTDYVQGIGMSKIEANIEHQLRETFTQGAQANTSPPAAHRRHNTQGTPSDLRELLDGIRKNRIITVNAPGVSAISICQLVEQYLPGAIHIAPTDAIFSGLKGERIARHLLREFIQTDVASPNVSSRTVVLHDSSALDLLLANKLFRNLTKAERLIFVGDKEMMPSGGVGEIFPTLLNSSAITHFDAFQTFIPGNDSPLSKALYQLGRRELPDGSSRPRSPHHVNIICSTEAGAAALRAYREAYESQPGQAIVLTSSWNTASRLNFAYHREIVDYRIALGEPTPLLKLRQAQEATIGDAVTFHGRDYARGLFRGSRGLVTAIYSEEDRLSLKDPSAVAEVAMDTAGAVQVSRSDCALLSLGHAVPLQHCVLSRWNQVISWIEPRRHVDRLWCWRAFSRALAVLTIVAEPNVFENVVSRTIRSPRYLSRFDI